MEKNKIALQLFSVRQDLKEDFYGTLKQVKEMGYSGVEFAGLYDNDPLEVKKMCQEIGLVPISAHVPFQKLLEETEATIDCYKKLGVRYVVIPSLAEEYRPGREKFPDFTEALIRIGTALVKEGMVLQYHNHDFEFEKLDGEYLLDIMYRTVDPAYLQTQLDTCWVNVGGADPVAYIHKYAGRIPTIHLKDFAGSKSENMYVLIGVNEDKKQETKGTFELRPVGKGVQDFPSIIEAADQAGAEWFIVEQDSPSLGLTPLECAKASVTYLLKDILG